MSGRFLRSACSIAALLLDVGSGTAWAQDEMFVANRGNLGGQGSKITVHAQTASGNVALTRALERMPLYFIENRGQLDSRVAYYVQGRDTTLYFTAEGMTLAQIEGRHEGNGSKGRLEKASFGRDGIHIPNPGSRWVVKLDFLGANPHPKIVAGDPTPAVVSYFKGRKEEWKTGLSTYGSIVYSDLWPGIDLVYSGTADRLKYTFLVKPGADPAQVRLAYRGVRGIGLNEAGQLEVETPAGGFRDDKPYAYQEVDGRRVEINAAYSLDGTSGAGPHRYGFALGSYDRGKPLVLDPAVFVYAGYIGGSGFDFGNGIAVDSSGNAYVTGYTDSTEATFPVAVGPDLTHNGGRDAFVAKVNAAGTALLYCSYIGGSGRDIGNGIAVDSSGNAYVTGYTESTEATFPVTVGPDLTSDGSGDAFVAKVDAAGTALLYCGYIGGNGFEVGFGIAVDTSGNAYVTGQTIASESTFPATVGPDLTYNGNTDAFVAKVNAAGTALVYCGYIGGSGYESGYGIAVDTSGNAYVTGYTGSTEVTFPVAVGPDLIANGVEDAFVAKVNAAGTALLYCGYIGGSGYDGGNGIAVDSSGNAYVTGQTASTEATFPVAVGPYVTYNGGTFDAFVAKVNTAGTALTYCGYVGGSSQEYGHGIAVDASGNAYVTGTTGSTEATFPVTVGPDLTHNGGTYDAFVAKLNAAGNALLYCGYIGGSGGDQGYGIAVDTSGNAYVTGSTGSTGATFPVTVGPYLTYNGLGDAFVAKIGTGAAPAPTVTGVFPPSGPESGGTPVTITGGNFEPGATVTFGGVAANPSTTTVLDAATILAVTPAHAGATAVDVVVTNPDLNSGTLPLGYTYTAACTPPQQPVASNGGPYCLADTIALSAATVAGATYSWTGPAAFTSNVQNPAIPNASAAMGGNYTVTITAAGCTYTGTTTVAVNSCTGTPTPVITTLPVAGAGSPNRRASVALHPGSVYVWVVTGNGTLDPAGLGTSEITFTAGAPGTVNLSVVEFDPAYGSIASLPGTATVDVLPAGSAIQFYIVTPCRLVDTRLAVTGNGLGGPNLMPGQSRKFTPALSTCGIPDTAKALLVNVTVALPGSTGDIVVWGDGVPMPSTPLMMFRPGLTRALMAAIVKFGDSFWIHNESAGTTPVIVDASGYFE